MTPDALKECLTDIRWTERRLAEVLDATERTVKRWGSGQDVIPIPVAEWLTDLANAHRASTPPKIRPDNSGAPALRSGAQTASFVAEPNATRRPVTSDDASAFCNECVLARSLYRHREILFESGNDVHGLLYRAAPVFFGDIAHVLTHQIIAVICKITDPEHSKGGENLTIPFLLKNADFAACPSDKTKAVEISDRIHVFVDKIRPARNKLISHLDRFAATGNESLGAASPAEWEGFWLDLQDFVQIIHKVYLNPDGLFYLNDISIASDADSLINVIRRSPVIQ